VSFTHDLIATIRYQLQQMRVDEDPNLPELEIHVTRDLRNGILQSVKIDRIGHAVKAPPGALTREALDNHRD